MNRFIVSARKYRPQNFSTVVGQSHITTTLKNAIRNHQLAHAFLFCGPRGVGKTTCARILAKAINCENPAPDGEACNTCHSCISFNEGSSLNIHELDAASNNSVEDIRSLVDQVRFAPQAGKYKVYIIDEVHMLSAQAFNAFLKTLEEPPPYAIFILATTEKHKILPTILSRCQVFDFKRITNQDITVHLKEICEKEGIPADKASLGMIAQKSEGCMRDALSIMDKIVSFSDGKLTYQETLEHLNILDEDYYFRLLDIIMNQQLADALLIYDEINRKGFEGDLLLNGFAEFVRNLLVCKDEKAAALLDVVEEFRPRYKTAARQTDGGYLISLLHILSESELNFKAARNKRLHVELALIKMAYLRQAIQLISQDGKLEKKKSAESAKPVAFRTMQPVEWQPAKKPTAPVAGPVKTPVPEQTARLVVDTSLLKPESAAPSLSALSKIRQEVMSRQQAAARETKPLGPESLNSCLEQFTAQLRQNKSSATQSFQNATLVVTGDQTFEIVAQNNLEQKFIEQEKRNLSDFLQLAFNNKNISFTVGIRQNQGAPPMADKMLTRREQFLQLAEQYPLLKELKDRLKLELDY
jgi:DNA polymerase III subunit gamma/tau